MNLEKIKMKFWKKILITVLMLILVLFLVGCGIMTYMTEKMTVDSTSKTEEDLGIEQRESWSAPYNEGGIDGSAIGVPFVEPKNKNDYLSIVLFGLSGVEEYDENRSDSIIICTFDKVHKQIKLTSILRDTKAYIEGYRPQKINAAYRYGGPWLALKTLNQNFNLDMKEYVTVDFDQMGAVVDVLGGVSIDLTQGEADIINENCFGSVTEGTNILNGKEAVWYSRIRSIGSDVERSNRQKRVLNSILNAVKKKNLLELVGIGREVLGIVSTSLSPWDLLKFIVIPFYNYELVVNNVPDENKDVNVWGGIDEYGEWVWIYDMQYAALRIHNFIYG